MDLISVIVPVYNVKIYLERCLESIIVQTYKNIEIIVVDDGSTDGSSEICDIYEMKYDNIYTIHKTNGGLSDARNKGLEHASGRYVVFIDSDDIISENHVEYLYQLIIKNKADIGICDPVHCYPNQPVVFCKETKEKVFNSEDAIVEMLYQKSFLVSAWGKIYPIEFFNDIKFPVGMLFEDSAIMYKLFEKAEKIVYGNAKLYGYMHRADSITTQKFSYKDLDIIKICNQIVEHYSKSSIKLIKAAQVYKINACLRVSLNAAYDNYKEVVDDCNIYIKENTMVTIRNSYVRHKTKVALVLWLIAKPIVPFIYKHVDRWK